MASPCFQFYPEEFVGSGTVGTADSDEVCAYTMLLCLDWTETGFAFDEVRLARWCKLPRPRFKKAWAHLASKFPARDGRHYNPRLEKERAKQQAWHEKSSNGGKKGAAARWGTGEHPDKGGDKGGHSMVVTKPSPSDDIPLPLPLPSPVTTTATAALSPTDAKAQQVPDGLSEHWVSEVGDRWIASVGAIPHGRVGKDLAQIHRVYGVPAMLAAVGKFAEHRRRQIAAGNDKPDGWPQFVREFRDYVPPPLLPARGAA